MASKQTSGGNSIIIAARSRDTVIQFASILILTERSKLYSMIAVFNEERRAIEGVPQIVEWDRMQSVMCMSHGIPSANINMKAGSIVFCTAKTMRFSECYYLTCLGTTLTIRTSRGIFTCQKPGKLLQAVQAPCIV